MDIPKDRPVKSTSTTHYWLMDNNILYSKVVEGAKIQLDDALENERARVELLGGKVVPIIIDIRGIKEISYEARKHSQKSGPTSGIYAAAIMVSSTISKVVGSFAIGLNQPAIPTKLFTDVDKAITWLQSIDPQGHPFRK